VRVKSECKVFGDPISSSNDAGRSLAAESGHDVNLTLDRPVRQTFQNDEEVIVASRSRVAPGLRAEQRHAPQVVGKGRLQPFHELGQIGLGRTAIVVSLPAMSNPAGLTDGRS